jgi:phenylacetate-CoA ligase
MNRYHELHDHVVGRITFPFLNYLFNRKNILADYKAMAKSERYPEELWRDAQFKKLIKLVEYANAHIPFYRRKFKSIGLEPKALKKLEDVKLIPPLSRQDVIDCREAMVDARLQASRRRADEANRPPGEPIPFAGFRRHQLVRNTSSGSTGAPTIFYETGAVTACNWACELRLKSWYGIHPGAREARMVRLAADYLPSSNAIRLRKLFWNQLILPGVNLSEEEYDHCYRQIAQFKPEVLWGFTSALAGLADYIQRNKKTLPANHPKLVIGWAAPVYEHEKIILMQAFACPVANIYGAREVGHVAATCPHGAFHLNQEHLYVESEAENNSPGEILVTTLDVSPMPFIRYRMGDLGKVTRSHCACGRSLETLTEFLGRTGEVFITRDGRMISPNFWCRTFMSAQLAHAISRFQVLYTKSGNIRIRIARNDNYRPETEAGLRKHLEKNFHSDINITFEYVPRIDPQVSGKYQMVINEANSCNATATSSSAGILPADKTASVGCLRYTRY